MRLLRWRRPLAAPCCRPLTNSLPRWKEEEAADHTGTTVSNGNRHLGQKDASLITMGTEWAATQFTTAMGYSIRDQFTETREASERETAAINSSWDRFIVKQDARRLPRWQSIGHRLRGHRKGNGKEKRRVDRCDGSALRHLGSQIWGHPGP